MATFLTFTAEDIRKKIPMRKAIDLMKDAFRQLSSGGAVVPLRTVIDSHDQSGRALFMPSYSSAHGLFGLKMVSVFANNVDKGLPVIQGKMMVMDGSNGTPLASMDAEYLTALRTGAASGLASDLLAGNAASILALFGTGAQSETQLEGVLSVRALKEIIVFGRDGGKTISFCKSMQEKFGVDIHPALSSAELSRADIICTATTSTTPVFQADHVKRGVHINAVGALQIDDAGNSFRNNSEINFDC